MPTHYDITYKVIIPKRSFDKWQEAINNVHLDTDVPENIREIIEHKLHGLNPNISVVTGITEETVHRKNPEI